MQENSNIINEFERLTKQIQFDMDHEPDRKKRFAHSFRLKSIETVLKVLKKYPKKITSSEQLKGIKGVGKNSLARIDEILESGKLSEIMADIQDQSYLKYIEELEEIYGIGKRKAYELFKDYGVKSIDDLKKLYNSGKITLPDAVVKGLKYYGIAKDNIPRSEMIEIDKYLHDVLLKIDPQLFGIICGSYRRMKPTSGDIDMLIVHPLVKSKSKVITKNYLQLFVQKLKDTGFIVDSLTGEDVPTKYMGFCQLNDYPVRRIDIRFMPYDSYYSAILYFTGSKDFNKKMRQTAISMGYTLNEYGLFDANGKMSKVSSEKDIFDILGMEYIDPEGR